MKIQNKIVSIILVGIFMFSTSLYADNYNHNDGKICIKQGLEWFTYGPTLKLNDVVIQKPCYPGYSSTISSVHEGDQIKVSLPFPGKTSTYTVGNNIQINGTLHLSGAAFIQWNRVSSDDCYLK